jgi:hypothetical protein
MLIIENNVTLGIDKYTYGSIIKLTSSEIALKMINAGFEEVRWMI